MMFHLWLCQQPAKKTWPWRGYEVIDWLILEGHEVIRRLRRRDRGVSSYQIALPLLGAIQPLLPFSRSN